MFGTTFDPIDALWGPRGGRSSPKFRFSVFKRKLQEIQPQKLIIICWYGCCGYGEVGIDPKMGGGTPRGVFNVEKTEKCSNFV